MHDCFQQKSEIESAPLGSECVLYSPSSNKFLHLNQTASFIWSRIKEPATADQIAGDLAGSFSGVSRTDATRDVESTLKDFVSLSVVETLPPAETTRPIPRENR